MNSSGYAVIPGVIESDECTALSVALESASLSRAGARHLMRVPEVNHIAHDARPLSIARASLDSPTAVPFQRHFVQQNVNGELAHRVASGHRAAARQTIRRSGVGTLVLEGLERREHLVRSCARVGIETDCRSAVASTSENGPLRVIPATHHRLLTDIEVDTVAAEQGERAVDCLSPRGGSSPCGLSSFMRRRKSSTTRSERVLHIEYAPSLYCATKSN